MHFSKKDKNKPTRKNSHEERDLGLDIKRTDSIRAIVDEGPYMEISKSQ